MINEDNEEGLVEYGNRSQECHNGWELGRAGQQLQPQPQ
jgi:hypothetical protein